MAKVEQTYIQTGWTQDTEDGLHMEATKGSVDGKIRITASVKGAHGEPGFWISKSPESWDKFVSVLPDIETGIASFHETRAAIAELEAKNELRRAALAKVEMAREFLAPEAFKAALAKVDHDYPEAVLKGNGSKAVMAK